jgi:hypothetical protein
MNLRRVTYAQEPALVDVVFDAVKRHVWPEFMFHDPIAGRLWNRLETDFAEYQFALKDDAGAIVAVGHTLPFRWDDPLEALPERGWDAIFVKAVADLEAGREPNMATAIEASIHPMYRGRGVSKLIIGEMRAIAKAKRFTSLVAPVRPSEKAKYPLAPMERYMTWANDKDEPFDAWIRTHWRLGARIVKVAPRSMVITGSVAEWEAWTGMRFPDSGNYVVPGALTPVVIDRARDCGEYIEPNVWMEHSL